MGMEGFLGLSAKSENCHNLTSGLKRKKLEQDDSSRSIVYIFIVIA
jgi:hypothetical protein